MLMLMDQLAKTVGSTETLKPHAAADARIVYTHCLYSVYQKSNVSIFNPFSLTRGSAFSHICFSITCIISKQAMCTFSCS